MLPTWWKYMCYLAITHAISPGKLHWYIALHWDSESVLISSQHLKSTQSWEAWEVRLWVSRGRRMGSMPTWVSHLQSHLWALLWDWLPPSLWRDGKEWETPPSSPPCKASTCYRCCIPSFKMIFNTHWKSCFFFRCVQYKNLTLDMLEKLGVMVVDLPDISEDCLYLNIYTPANRTLDAKLPVSCSMWYSVNLFRFG